MIIESNPILDHISISSHRWRPFQPVDLGHFSPKQKKKDAKSFPAIVIFSLAFPICLDLQLEDIFEQLDYANKRFL